MQAGPDAVYCHRRCADLELIDRLAVIRASVPAAAVLGPWLANMQSVRIARTEVTRPVTTSCRPACADGLAAVAR